MTKFNFLSAEILAPEFGWLCCPVKLVRHRSTRLVWLIVAVSLSLVFPAWAESVDQRSIEQGRYIYTMGGCESCHVDEKSKQLGPAGGGELETPFGTFFTPNITPDNETGIGGWSDRQFLDAMRKGLSPDGEHYYPSFPYTSYALMNARDLLDLKAYLDSLKPVIREVKTHELSFPFSQRWLMKYWKMLFFEQQTFQPDSSQSEAWNRGAYIVNGAGHCAECHTPRNLFGGLKTDEQLAGNSDGPDGESVPSINPNISESFKKWSGDEIVFALQTGMLPNGDFFGGSMGYVVENCTSKLNDYDLQSIAAYLQSPESGGTFSADNGSTVDVAENAVIIGSGNGGKYGGAVR